MSKKSITTNNVAVNIYAIFQNICDNILTTTENVNTKITDCKETNCNNDCNNCPSTTEKITKTDRQKQHPNNFHHNCSCPHTKDGHHCDGCSSCRRHQLKEDAEKQR